MTPFRPALAAGALVLLLAAPVAAQPTTARGPYAEGSLGVTGGLGTAGSTVRPGPAFALRAGLDLLSWLALGVRLDLETHAAQVPPPPEGEYVQLYGAAGDARITVSTGRLALFADGSFGLALVSTNLLARVDILDPGEHFSSLIAAGGGLEYQLDNRHYAVGLAGQWTLMLAFDRLQTAGARAYLRYTY